MGKQKKHLTKEETVNLGSYYTSDTIVDLTYSLLKKNIKNTKDYTILDSSCGYGSFLGKDDIAKRLVGSDVDKKAIHEAKKRTKNVSYIHTNALSKVSRKVFKIKETEKLIIIGNPPYNDTTSMVNNSIKDKSVNDLIDKDIKTRDLGMSFLLSYEKLKADYVCVLHPLSYLIKKANFSILSKFTESYKLIDGIIISSHEFDDTSRTTAFPIIIALYKRDTVGMDYKYIENYKFKVKEGGTFRLNNFDTVANYIHKYPNKNLLKKSDKPIAKFWTLRDINALKRNRTFIEKDTTGTVYITSDKIHYYCYIDVFKSYIDIFPYFMGNCDIIIDHNKFIKIKDHFISYSLENNTSLKKKLKFKTLPNSKKKIEVYFQELLLEKLGSRYIPKLS